MFDFDGIGPTLFEIEVQNCKRNETISLMKTRLVNYPL